MNAEVGHIYEVNLLNLKDHNPDDQNDDEDDEDDDHSVITITISITHSLSLPLSLTLSLSTLFAHLVRYVVATQVQLGDHRSQGQDFNQEGHLRREHSTVIDEKGAWHSN